MKLKGRVAFITGASGGIGREIALAFAREGAHVGLAARSVDKLEAVAAEVEGLGSKAVVCRCDVMKDEDIVGAIRATVKALGPIDILVNNAGIVSFEPVHRLPDEVWRRTIQINLTAPFVAIREVLPSMRERKRGRIINVASVSGKIGLPFRSAYAASKHGVLGLTKSLAAEVATLGITANSICPTFVDTPMFQESIQKFADETGKSFQEMSEELRNRVPMKRFIGAAEVAPLALYLASDDSAGMTGQSINVDGGFITH
jgi:3-hydroxybutyrate dehydrogenase